MKDKIITTLSTINRPGMPALLDFLRANEDTAAGFFGAPASTHFHLCRPGGLAEHSLNVYQALVRIRAEHQLDIPHESVIIAGLLHDVCKVDFYKEGFKNVKDPATGQWSEVACYEVDEAAPLGHGEKSVITLQRFIKLEYAEAMAIRWHMGAWSAEGFEQRRQLNQAMDKTPLLRALMLADQTASFFMEDR